MLALTKKMVWSASMTTLKNTTTQQCSTKLTKRCGGSDLCSLFLCFAWIACSCNTQILHEFLKMSTCLFFPLFSDVEMYTAGWETKVYGSGNHSKPTICAEGEGGLQQHWSCFFLLGVLSLMAPTPVSHNIKTTCPILSKSMLPRELGHSWQSKIHKNIKKQVFPVKCLFNKNNRWLF